MTLTIVTLWGGPLQFYVDKQNYLSVRRVLYQKQGGPDAPEGGW